jgi:hypothetical protein
LVSGPPSLGREEFVAAYVGAVHGGLDKVLGVSGTSAVLFHMKMTGSLPNPGEFDKRLLSLFGVQGALSLERAILKDLATRLSWSLDLLTIEGPFDFDGTMKTLEKGGKSR